MPKNTTAVAPVGGQQPVEDDRVDHRVLGDDQLHPHQHELGQREDQERQRRRDEHHADDLVVAARRVLDPRRAPARHRVGDDLGPGGGDRGRGCAHSTSPAPGAGAAAGAASSGAGPPPPPASSACSSPVASASRRRPRADLLLDGLLGLLDRGLLVAEPGLVLRGAQDADAGAHRRVGRARELRRLAEVLALLVGLEPGRVGASRHGVELAAERRDPPAVGDVGRDDPQNDGRVDGDDERRSS